MKNIDEHIDYDKKILDDPMTSPQTRRHTAEELENLEEYKQNHPNEDYDPTPLELYCYKNPHALECRVYDD
jgi:hypothetical protein